MTEQELNYEETDKLAKSMFGRSLKSAHSLRVCISCQDKALKKSFRSKDYYDEYKQHGLCQNCQDDLA